MLQWRAWKEQWQQKHLCRVDDSAISNHRARNRAAIARGNDSARYVWQRNSAICRGICAN
jgi:hypothetical protein